VYIVSNYLVDNSRLPNTHSKVAPDCTEGKSHERMMSKEMVALELLLTVVIERGNDWFVIGGTVITVLSLILN
jgi:hypothetical protein